MSVLRSKRNISKTEYENTLANLYRYSMNKTIAVPKRRRKWLCAEIDGIMNKVYSDVMELGTGYIPNAEGTKVIFQKRLLKMVVASSRRF